MELILWRHADAEQGIPDSERKLTAKGERQAVRVAKWLKTRLPDDAKILSSPAKRAQQTARALAKNFKLVNALDTGADAESLLAACGWPRAEGTVVAVGHQPVLGQAAALALTGKTGEWSLKKGAVFWLETRGRGAAQQVTVRAAISPDLT